MLGLQLHSASSLTAANDVISLCLQGPEVLRCMTKKSPEDYKERLDLAYGCPADLWSVGCVAFEALTGNTPYNAERVDEMLALIMQPLCFPPHVAGLEDVVSFLEGCLTIDPSHRPTAPELLNHPWLQRAQQAPEPTPARAVPKARTRKVSVCLQASTTLISYDC